MHNHHHSTTKDSSRESMHVVHSGETLSGIAQHYHGRGWRDLSNWHPIFNLTRERTGLWANARRSHQLDNPNMIYPGDLLIIPRSRAAYRELVSRMESIRSEVAASLQYAAEIQDEAETYSKGLDLTSDVLRAIATAGVSALVSAKTAKVALRVAAKRALEEQRKDALEMSAKVVEYAALKTGHKQVAYYAGKTATLAKVASTVGDLRDLQKNAKDLAKNKEYWALAGKIAGPVVDVLDMCMEVTSPSTWAKFYIKVFNHVDVDKTLAENAQKEKELRQRTIDSLNQKIARLKHEMLHVYRVN